MYNSPIVDDISIALPIESLQQRVPTVLSPVNADAERRKQADCSIATRATIEHACPNKVLAAATSCARIPRPSYTPSLLAVPPPHTPADPQDLAQNSQHPHNTMSNWSDDAANWTGRQVRCPLSTSLQQI